MFHPRRAEMVDVRERLLKKSSLSHGLTREVNDVRFVNQSMSARFTVRDGRESCILLMSSSGASEL